MRRCRRFCSRACPNWRCRRPWNTACGSWATRVWCGCATGTWRSIYGHVLSGVSGLLAAYTDTPSGGPGFSAAFPQGPSLKKLAPNEPISIDLAACVNGYVVDMTRMYALGSLPSRAWEAWEAVEELYRLYTAGGQARDQSRGNLPPALGRRPEPGPGGLLYGAGRRPGQFPGPRGGPGTG